MNRFMKWLVALAFLGGSAAFAQVSQEPVTVQSFQPSGSCATTPTAPLIKVTGVGTWQCVANVWTQLGTGGGGLSGMTAGQVPIAATDTTVTSSKPVSSGTRITTGPGTVVSGDFAKFFGTDGALTDGGSNISVTAGGTGVTTGLTVLNAGNLASGTVPAARLPVIPPTLLPSGIPAGNGLLGYWRFRETAGTVLTDYSGLGNDGTIVGTGLTRDGIGYSGTTTTSYATLPTTVNSANSFVMVTGLPVLVPGSNLNWQGAYFGNLTSNTAPYFYSQNLQVDTGTGTYGVAGAGGATGLAQMGTNFFGGGTHVVAMTCPAGAAPKLYIDGALATPSMSLTGPSCNNTGAGNIIFGGNVRNGVPFGTNSSTIFYGFAAFSAVLTDAQVAQYSSSLLSNAVAQGVPVSPTNPFPATNPYDITVGDSIPCGFELTGGTTVCQTGSTASNSYPVTTDTLTTNAYVTLNYGVPNASVQPHVVAIDQYLQYCRPLRGSSFAAIHAGINNFAKVGGQTPPQVASLLAAWIGRMKQAGCKVGIVAILSSTGNSSAGPTQDAQAQALNQIIRGSWKSWGASFFVDLGADPNLGALLAYANTTNFFPDGIHPQLVMHNRIATAKACLENAVDGSSPDLMNPALITASATLACADEGRYIDATSANVNVTLPSALWLTGRRIRLCNATPGVSVNTVTVTGPSDFGINNGTAGNTITIAQNACAVLESNWNGQQSIAATGEYWRTL